MRQPTTSPDSDSTATAMLDAADVPASDVTRRLPTLDDVFLTLTGHASEPVADRDLEEVLV